MAPTPILNSLAAGAVFGAALTAAGVYSPSVIVGQMQLSDFHMLKAFLAASASSAIAIIISQRLQLTNCKPRTPNTLNLFSPYDGNILGGGLLGIGMALSGACPGTLLPQIATGVRSGPFVLLGGILGGILFSGYGKRYLGMVSDGETIAKPTVYQKMGGDRTNAVAVYEVMCLSGIEAVRKFYPEKVGVLLPAAVGGLWIGFSQFMSLFLTGSTLGVSTAYEQLGDLYWWLSGRVLEGKKGPMPSIRGTVFAAGTMIGALVLSMLIEIPSPNENIEVSAARAVMGGILLVVGARFAGGCTSGHGISGMSQLSVASILTSASMFAGGIAFNGLLRAF
ncbi:YeeE/YedE family protein [Mollisia scopiformis]|uniref:YeeE/YedE family protein n=1 Tax=Mollisia scopiformis TaxID=149040 RepID=A0A194WY27_MOLSC|nr:YeeE/YedE family protein [Mollisia scopiformis]KUJ12589.1 YeeE/YedE family protein [Mollisia scopiformis]